LTVGFWPILLKNSFSGRHRTGIEKLSLQIGARSRISSRERVKHSQEGNRASLEGGFQQNRPRAAAGEGRYPTQSGLSHLSMAISTLISEEIAGSQPLQRGAMWLCPGQCMAINA
jgi:hypothetical protein